MTGCVVRAVLTILCTVPVVFSLQCHPEHPQRNFCEAAWVIKGTIKTRIETPSSVKGDPPIERQYDVRIDRIFKQPMSSTFEGTWHNGSRIWISTDGDMTKAGVRMKRDRSYLISGIMYEGRPFLTKCNWHQKWGKVSRCHESGLEFGIFLQNCNCQVSTCMGNKCYQPVGNKGCVNINYENTYDICRFDQTSGSCGWTVCGHVEKVSPHKPASRMNMKSMRRLKLHSQSPLWRRSPAIQRPTSMTSHPVPTTGSVISALIHVLTSPTTTPSPGPSSSMSFDFGMGFLGWK